MDQKKQKQYEKFEIITIKRSQINFAQYNPRTISAEAKRKLKENIKRVGLLEPIIWNEITGNVVSGHQRLQCMDSLNSDKDDYDITVSKVNLDEKTEKEQNIFMNNKLAQGEYDFDKMQDILKDVDYELAGFNPAEVHKCFGEDILATNINNSEEIKKLSKDLDDFKDNFENIKQKNKQRDISHFYLCLVFKDYNSRLEFTNKYFLDDNLFQDPRDLEQKIIDSVI